MVAEHVSRAVIYGARPARARWIVVTALIAAIAGVLTGWASVRLFTPPVSPLVRASYTTVTAETQTISSQLTLDTTAKWPTAATAENQAQGIVTSVVAQTGSRVSAGSTLYTVNLRPVVVAQGAIPSFEDISGGTKGQDVKQLQQLLTSLGDYSGTIDGSDDQGTTQAVRRWQKSLGVPESGTVAKGDIVYLPALPAEVQLDPTKIVAGATLSGGEPAVSSLTPTPTFELDLSPQQAAQVTSGLEATIQFGTHKWSAVTGPESSQADQTDASSSPSTVIIELRAEGDQPICAVDCAQIPLSGATGLQTAIDLVKPCTGPAIPVAAVNTTPQGGTYVVDAAGRRHSVRILVSANGECVVDGIAPGTRVRIDGSSGV